MNNDFVFYNKEGDEIVYDEVERLWKNLRTNLWIDDYHYEPFRKERRRTLVEKGDRPTFTEALEEAFWQAGGIDLLLKVAREEPIEFLRTCAKLIPADIKAGPDGQITVNVLTLKQDEVESSKKIN